MQLNHILSAATAGLCKETCHVGLIASGDHSKYLRRLKREARACSLITSSQPPQQVHERKGATLD